MREITVIFLLLVCVHLGSNYSWDKPCAARQANSSYVCVCNATYCDKVTRETPQYGKFLAYMTSQDGMRFEKSAGLLQQYFEDSTSKLASLSTSGTLMKFEESQQYGEKLATPPKDCNTLELNPHKRYQTIEGFGGAVTDSASINWSALQNEQLKRYLVESYFGPEGIGYNMIRVNVGGCDFSTRAYAYNDLPVNDTHLSNFTLAYEDLTFKIPMIRACMKAATAPVHVLGSTWSPPLWMKNPSNTDRINFLRPEYFQTYADYHLKFIQKYAERGVPIWGVTITNEPLSGIMSLGHINRLSWTVKDLGNWIASNLGPTLRNSEFNVKLITGDDQRFTVPIWFNQVVHQKPAALDFIDGVAVHFYYDNISPPTLLTKAMQKYPDKFVISTEACTGLGEKPHVLLGSWERAVKYIEDIIEDLNYNVTGWIDWNICLNSEGGPNYIKNFVDSPIIVFPERGEFVKQPMFYALGHFSKFIPRGSQRIDSNQNKCCDVQNVAFVTPENTIVAVLYNGEDDGREVSLKLHDKVAAVNLPPKSIVTVEFPNFD